MGPFNYPYESKKKEKEEDRERSGVINKVYVYYNINTI
jgi:hypothetical protein